MQKQYSQNEIKKMLYRSWHRGCKETDILLGDYAKNKIFDLNDSQLALLEKLLEVDDTFLYNWITEKSSAPEEHDHEILRDIKEFHKARNA